MAGRIRPEIFTPFWKLCQICLPVLRPNLIVKSEHLKEDLAFIRRKLKLEDSEVDKLSEGSFMSEATKSYFSTLSQNQIFQFYDIFRLDHEIFGYDPRPYFDLATLP
jgi:hypothetical protein